MNVHGFNEQGKSLDAVMNCVEKVRKVSDDPKSVNCAALSDMVPPKDETQAKIHGAGGFIATPIYPANDPLTLVGFIFGKVHWREVMMDMLPADVEGIDCVFSTEKKKFTYTIKNGSAELIGPGDLHDPNYDEFAMSSELFDPASVGPESVTYQVTCYPNATFDAIYRTTNPLVAAIGAVLVILFTSSLFLLYDFFVRKEFNAKRDLLEAKRNFVRFVSHEGMLRFPFFFSVEVTCLSNDFSSTYAFQSSSYSSQLRVHGIDSLTRGDCLISRLRVC